MNIKIFSKVNPQVLREKAIALKTGLENYIKSIDNLIKTSESEALARENFEKVKADVIITTGDRKGATKRVKTIQSNLKGIV